MQTAVADNSVTRTRRARLAAPSAATTSRRVSRRGAAAARGMAGGRCEPPTAIYMRALDLVRAGPFATPHRGRERARKSLT